ncbi:MAG: phosphate signaling complex protein PhoU [Gallionella sp.]|nr:phosphate signaling complex protein PhoU [Gallionella sp.]
MSNTPHTSHKFDAELDALRAHVMEMGDLVENQIRMAIEGLSNGDVVLMERVIDDDHLVNVLQSSIDEGCTQILACRQPAASDLRMVMMVLKTIADLESIGDEAKKIARMVKLLAEENTLRLPCYKETRHSAKMALEMVRNSLDAFARLDLALAAQVVRQDEQVDAEFHSILRHLITFMMEDPRTISAALEIVSVAKAIERIGDHAKNIAEYVFYMVKGLDLRHVTVEEIEHQARS